MRTIKTTADRLIGLYNTRFITSSYYYMASATRPDVNRWPRVYSYGSPSKHERYEIVTSLKTTDRLQQGSAVLNLWDDKKARKNPLWPLCKYVDKTQSKGPLNPCYTYQQPHRIAAVLRIQSTYLERVRRTLTDYVALVDAPHRIPYRLFRPDDPATGRRIEQWQETCRLWSEDNLDKMHYEHELQNFIGQGVYKVKAHRGKQKYRFFRPPATVAKLLADTYLISDDDSLREKIPLAVFEQSLDLKHFKHTQREPELIPTHMNAYAVWLSTGIALAQSIDNVYLWRVLATKQPVNCLQTAANKMLLAKYMRKSSTSMQRGVSYDIALGTAKTMRSNYRQHTNDANYLDAYRLLWKEYRKTIKHPALSLVHPESHKVETCWKGLKHHLLGGNGKTYPDL